MTQSDPAIPPTIDGEVVDGPPAPDSPPPQPPRPARPFRSYLPVLYALGLVIVGAVIFYMWENPPVPPEQAAMPAQLAEAQAKVAELQTRLAALEQRPQPRAPDLSPIEKRLASLEQTKPATTDLSPVDRRLSALEQVKPAAATDIGPLDKRLAALEQVKPPAPVDLGPLATRIEALEKKPAPDAVSHAELGAVSTRLDAVAGREDQLAARAQELNTALTGRIEAEDKKLAALDGKIDSKLGDVGKSLTTLETSSGASAKQLAAIGDRAGRIGRLQAAQGALDSGHPLGDLPGAPPALLKFATAAPPTLASLKLSFPAAMHAAQDSAVASAVATAKPDKAAPAPAFWDRIRNRAQSLVTVREGDTVIVGDPSAGVIARAKQALDAGDLAGTVGALDALSGPPASAFAPWRAQAQSLLDARSAIAALAAAA